MTERESFLGTAAVTESDRAAWDAWLRYCDMRVRRFISSMAIDYRVLCEARQAATGGML